MTLTRLNPAHDVWAVETERLNRMFDTMFGREALSGAGWQPAVDIYETESHDVVVKVEVPGFRREDIKVTFENNVLTLEGERKAATDVKREQYHRLERTYGTFRRSFTMPASVDGGRVQAAYADGVLTITLPQRAEAKPRQIEVG